MTPMRLLLADGSIISGADTPIAVQLDDRLDAVERAWVGNPPVELGREAFPVCVDLTPLQQQFLLKDADRERQNGWHRVLGDYSALHNAQRGLAALYASIPEEEPFIRRWLGFPPLGAER